MFSVMCVCLLTGVSMSPLGMMYLTLPYIDPLLQPLEHETSLHSYPGPHPLGSDNFGEEDLRPIQSCSLKDPLFRRCRHLVATEAHRYGRRAGSMHPTGMLYCSMDDHPC